jgi:hypothetical protein
MENDLAASAEFPPTLLELNLHNPHADDELVVPVWVAWEVDPMTSGTQQMQPATALVQPLTLS